MSGGIDAFKATSYVVIGTQSYVRCCNAWHRHLHLDLVLRREYLFLKNKWKDSTFAEKMKIRVDLTKLLNSLVLMESNTWVKHKDSIRYRLLVEMMSIVASHPDA